MYIISLILWINSINLSREFCGTEISQIRNSLNIAEWKIEKQNPQSVTATVSTPKCLDREGRTITRICFHGIWIPRRTPICHSSAGPSRAVCPQNSTMLEESCVYLTEPRTWFEGCHSNIPIKYLLNLNFPVWVSDRIRERNYREGKSDQEKCLVVERNSARFVNCLDKYPHLCYVGHSIQENVRNRIRRSATSINPTATVLEPNLVLSFESRHRKLFLTINNSQGKYIFSYVNKITCRVN